MKVEQLINELEANGYCWNASHIREAWENVEGRQKEEEETNRILSNLGKPKWEDQIAEGHNPHKLTNAQVGEGYRLARTDEIGTRELEVKRPFCWIEDRKYWEADNYGFYHVNTYRVPIEKELSYAERQEACGLKVGDRVKILRAAESKEDGWGLSWSPSMNHYVGTVQKVVGFDPDYGVRLGMDYTFPFFVLEKVEDKKAEPARNLMDELIWASTKLDYNTHLEQGPYEAIEILINVVKQLIPKEEK